MQPSSILQDGLYPQQAAPSVIHEEDMMYIHQAPYQYCLNGTSKEMHQPIMNVSQQHPLLGMKVVSADEHLHHRLGSQCHQGRTPATTSGRYLPLPQFGTKMQFPDKLFPDKLYDLLEMASAHDFGYASNAVSWMPHGRAFKVFDEDVFMACIVPTFFNQTKLRSFKRQLNLWGFKRLTMGHDAGGYYHESFVRGSQDKIKDIVRTGKKGTIKSAGTEPDFYSMPRSTPREGKANTMQAEQLPEPLLSWSNSCSNISASSNDSVHEFKSIVTHHHVTPSKSRRESVESMRGHFNESFTNPIVQECAPTANTPCLHDRGQECLEPLPFKNDARFDDLVRSSTMLLMRCKYECTRTGTI